MEQFRPMRRFRQQLSDDESVGILKKATSGTLALLGDNGYPYGFPINHYYDEETNRLYFHGANFGHHIDAIRRDPKVSYCVFGQEYQKDGDWAKYVKSVIVFGRAELIEDQEAFRKSLKKVLPVCWPSALILSILLAKKQ